MTLSIQLGDTIHLELDGHSAVNGAVIPDGSTIAITSNDPTVATVDTPVLPPGGAQHLVIGATVLATGSTDFHATVTAPDGSIFEATATLVVNPAAIPGLASVTLTIVKN
jgi:uncharacterized protein YjdB